MLILLVALELAMVPIARDAGAWTAALQPPWEVIDTDTPTAQAGYVPDSPLNEIKRPFQTQAEGGDCEDWAIAEYHWRRAAGEDGMLLVIGYDPALGDYHAVLLIKGRYLDPLGMMGVQFIPLYAVDERRVYRVLR